MLVEPHFYSRHAIARICHANSVCPSVSVCHTRAFYQNGWTYHRNSLVFRHQFCVSLTASPLTGVPDTRGSDFRPICGYIWSETVIDRSIVTVKDEYKVVCALSNSVAFDDLEWPRTPVSRLQYSLNTNISQNGASDPLHMFGSKLGFSGSADRMALFAVRQNPRWRLTAI